MEAKALYRISCGLYLVATKAGGRDNACITNTAMQVTAGESPELVISVVLEQGYMGGYAALTAGRILEAYYGVDGN